MLHCPLNFILPQYRKYAIRTTICVIVNSLLATAFEFKLGVEWSYLHKAMEFMFVHHLVLDMLHQEKSGENNTLVTAIIAMAHKLKLGVVAEGVENEDQLDFLQGQQCDYAQGYYFSEPLPVEEFEALLCAARSDSTQTLSTMR